MELEEEHIDPARGGGDVLLDEPVTTFEFVWDNFADGGYDSACHPDRCFSDLWADNSSNGSPLFLPKNSFNIPVSTPPGGQPIDVAATQNRASLRDRFRSVFSNTFSYMQTTFFEDEDEFKSVCSTEYFSCFSGSSVEPVKEQQEVELLFSKFKINLDVSVTPRGKDSSRKADDVDLKRNSSCRQWITEQYNGGDSKRIRYSNSSLAVDTGSWISEKSLMEWLQHPFVNIPIKSASDVTLSKSKETSSDEDFDSMIIKSMNNLPTIKGIVSRHFRLVPEDFTFTDEYIDDFYLNGDGRADTSGRDIEGNVIKSLSWLKIYPSSIKCPIVDLGSGETSTKTDGTLEQSLSPSSGDEYQRRNETDESVSKLFEETVDYRELQLNSTSTSQENKLFPTDTFEKIALTCGMESIDSNVRLSEMLLDNDEQSVSIDHLVPPHGNKECEKHHSQVEPLTFETPSEESSKDRITETKILNPEDTSSENENCDPFSMSFNKGSDYKTVKSLIDVFETSHNEHETFRTSFQRDGKEIDTTESKERLEFWHIKDNEWISSASEDHTSASDSTKSGSEDNKTSAYIKQNETAKQRDAGFGTNSVALVIGKMSKDIIEELLESAVQTVIQEQVNTPQSHDSGQLTLVASSTLKTKQDSPGLSSESSKTDSAEMFTKKVDYDYKPIRIDHSTIGNNRQRKCLSASSSASEKSEIELKGRKDRVTDVESQDSSSTISQINEVVKTFSKDIIYAARVDIAEENLALEYKRQRAKRFEHVSAMGSASAPPKGETKAEMVQGDTIVCKFGGGQCKCNRCVVQRKQFAVSKIPVRPGTDTRSQTKTNIPQSDQKISRKTIAKKPSLQIKGQNKNALSKTKQDFNPTSKCLPEKGPSRKSGSKKIEVKDTKKTAFLKDRARKKLTRTDKTNSQSQAENTAVARKLSCSVMPKYLLPAGKEHSVSDSVVESLENVVSSLDNGVPSLESVVPSLDSVARCLEMSETCGFHKRHGMTCSLCKHRKTNEFC